MRMTASIQPGMRQPGIVIDLHQIAAATVPNLLAGLLVQATVCKMVWQLRAANPANVADFATEKNNKGLQGCIQWLLPTFLVLLNIPCAQPVRFSLDWTYCERWFTDRSGASSLSDNQLYCTVGLAVA